MLEIANTRVEQLKDNGLAEAAVYDPPGVGGTSVVTVLAYGNQPELYGLPRNPTIPFAVRLWKGPLKWLGNAAMIGGLAAAVVHFVRFGRKQHDDDTEDGPGTEHARRAGASAPADTDGADTAGGTGS